MHMRLVENVHYEKICLDVKQWHGELHCYCVADGRAHLLRRTDPEADISDVEFLGRQLASDIKKRQAQASDARRLASGGPKI